MKLGRDEVEVSRRDDMAMLRRHATTVFCHYVYLFLSKNLSVVEHDRLRMGYISKMVQIIAHQMRLNKLQGTYKKGHRNPILNICKVS